jgi:MacB-like protein
VSSPIWGNLWAFAYPNFLDCRRESRSLDMAAFAYSGGIASQHGEAAYVDGFEISSNLFSVLGVPMARGRAFLPEDDHRTAAPVMIISYGLWQRFFDGSPDAVGRSLELDEKPYTIVGIASAGFKLEGEEGLEGQDAIVFTPLGQDASPVMQRRDRHPGIQVWARLHPGVKLAEAQTELALIGRHLAAEYPDTNKDRTFIAQPLRPDVGDAGSTLWLLLGAVAVRAAAEFRHHDSRSARHCPARELCAGPSCQPRRPHERPAPGIAAQSICQLRVGLRIGRVLGRRLSLDLGECRLLGGISDACPSETSERRERVSLAARRTEDVLHLNATRQERVRDQRAVTPPGYCFRAHDRDLFSACQLHQLLEVRREFRGLHVVGVPAEGGVAPTGVGRVAARMAQAAEPGHVYVPDPCRAERLRQRVAIELRITARARHGAHVREAFDAVDAQQADEVFDGPGGMTDGKDERRVGLFSRHGACSLEHSVARVL